MFSEFYLPTTKFCVLGLPLIIYTRMILLYSNYLKVEKDKDEERRRHFYSFIRQFARFATQLVLFSQNRENYLFPSVMNESFSLEISILMSVLNFLESESKISLSPNSETDFIFLIGPSKLLNCSFQQIFQSKFLLRLFYFFNFFF